jgi:hypothetical protein
MSEGTLQDSNRSKVIYDIERGTGRLLCSGPYYEDD